MSTPPLIPQRALFVVAHPDDIEFMAGGLAVRWAAEGAELHYCLLTDGASGSRDPEITPAALIEMRRAEQRTAGDLLGVRSYTFLGHPDGRLVASVELRLEIARVIRTVQPDAVVTTDPRFFYSPTYINHPDHRAAGEATLAAIMPIANTRLAALELLTEGLEPHDVGDVLRATPAEPNYWLPLREEDLAHKVAIMRAHASQIVQFPGFEEFILRMAREMGVRASDAGVACDAAEAYTHITLRRPPAYSEVQKH
ncbi:MAG TPA: PIG-L family deacetylase [Roseiflexaceae bacterium]|nr:PIG-L family deacetylase [Roseiflexaceae bacterium]